MKKTALSIALLLLASAVAGCSGQGNEETGAPASAAESASGSASSAASASSAEALPTAAASGDSEPTSSGEARLELERTSFELTQWKMDGSHTASVKGSLELAGKPVAGAVLHAGTSQRDIATGQDGGFELLVDQSLLADQPVHVVSLDGATIEGRPLDPKEKAKLMSASRTISVYYPIETTKVTENAKDPGLVDVYGRVVSQAGDVVSFFQIDKYRIGGIVKDAVGEPVQDAIVWIDRDEGEGFAKSTPTDENGRYEMYYLPEDDEGTNLTVTTDGGKKRYTLPKGKVFYIPDGTSVDIDITLPGEGTEIVDKPPTLVSVTSPGAMYTGVLVGLSVPQNVPYTVTIPDKEGNFVLTVPKEAWEDRPAFFETRMTKFVEDRELTWGDTLPSGFLQPKETDPRHIAGVSL